MFVIWKLFRAIVIAGLLGLGISSGYAGEVQDIQLRDGSVIRAEIISLRNGVYTLLSPTIGMMRIEQSDVVGTSSGTATPRQTSREPGTSQRIETTRRSLQSNPEAMEKIMSLKGDPAMRRILDNPKLMDAVRRGDLKSLSSDPDIKRLMNNPAVRDLIKRRQ